MFSKQAVVDTVNQVKTQLQDASSKYISHEKKDQVVEKAAQYSTVAQEKLIYYIVLVVLFMYNLALKMFAKYEASPVPAKIEPVTTKVSVFYQEKVSAHAIKAKDAVSTFYYDKVHAKAVTFDQKVLMSTVATIVSQVQEAIYPAEEKTIVEAIEETFQEVQEAIVNETVVDEAH